MNSNSETHLRRNFLKQTFTIGAAAILAPSLPAGHTSAAVDKFAITMGPYLQTSFGNEMTVLWITNRDAAGWVMFGTDPNKLDQKAFGNSNLGLRPANDRLNRVTIANLRPGETYYYQIYSKEITQFLPYKLTYGETVQSGIESFTNCDPTKKKISFLMFNDIHDRPKSIPHLFNLVRNKNHDFVFFNGDIFDYQTNEQQLLDNFLSPCVSLFAKKTPFVYVRGNHETRGQFAREFPRYFKQVGYDAFTLGPVRFVVIDTGEDKPDTEPVYGGIVDFDSYRKAQAELLRTEINSKAFKKARFRIVLMHIPPRFSGDWHGPKHCTALFEPLLNKGKVDLVLSGHTHKYKVHQPGESLNKYALVIGGGPKEGSRTITEITVDENELRVIMLNDNGAEVGRYFLRKS